MDPCSLEGLHELLLVDVAISFDINGHQSLLECQLLIRENLGSDISKDLLWSIESSQVVEVNLFLVIVLNELNLNDSSEEGIKLIQDGVDLLVRELLNWCH
jgi:hypothetical protein